MCIREKIRYAYQMAVQSQIREMEHFIQQTLVGRRHRHHHHFDRPRHTIILK